MLLVLTLKLYSAARASWMEASVHWLFLRLTKRNCGVKAHQQQQSQQRLQWEERGGAVDMNLASNISLASRKPNLLTVE